MPPALYARVAHALRAGEVLDLATLRRTTMTLQLPLAIMSYGWASRAHPDPDGSLLRRLVPVLEAMVKSCTDGVDPRDHRGPVAWGLVWDFMSLPQRGYTSGYVADVDDRTNNNNNNNGGAAPAAVDPAAAAAAAAAAAKEEEEKAKAERKTTILSAKERYLARKKAKSGGQK